MAIESEDMYLVLPGIPVSCGEFIVMGQHNLVETVAVPVHVAKFVAKDASP